MLECTHAFDEEAWAEVTGDPGHANDESRIQRGRFALVPPLECVGFRLGVLIWHRCTGLAEGL